MAVSPYFLLVGLGIGVGVVFVVGRLALFLRLSLALAKLAGIVCLIILAGYAVGLWHLPRPMAEFFAGLPQPWVAPQARVHEWFMNFWR